MSQVHQLVPFRELIRETPAIKPRTWIHWLASNMEGFRDSCVVKVGRKVFIDRIKLEVWLAQRRN